MKSILVIGAGIFGKHLAIELSELGNEVMAIDTDESKIRELLPHITKGSIGDCMDEQLLRTLGVGNFDVCFVCIGDNFQASLEITSLLKDMGAKWVVSKANRKIHEKFLLRNGADEIIHPERDMAIRTARRYSANNMLDYIELTDDYSICEIAVPESWIGKSIKQVNVRVKHNINIIGFKQGDKFIPLVNAEHVFSQGDHLFFAGNPKDSIRMTYVK